MKKQLLLLSLLTLLFINLASSATFSDVLGQDLVAYYPMNESSGEAGNIINYSQYNMTLALNTTFITTGGKKGGYIQCSPSDGDAQLYTSVIPHNVSTITLSAWIYPNLTGDSNPSTGQITFGKYQTGIDYNSRVSIQPNGTITFIDSVAPRDTNMTVEPNRWSHILYTYNGSGYYLYINGTMASEIINPTGYPDNQDFPLSGCHLLSAVGTDFIFEGGIDEFAYYSRGFNETDVAIMYNNGVGNFYGSNITEPEPEPEPETPPVSSVTNNEVYQLFNGAGAGTGIFLSYLTRALPALLLGIGIVGVVVIIGFALANVIRKSISP